MRVLRAVPEDLPGVALPCATSTMAILCGMARTTVKATYSLSPGVVDRLEHLAKIWKVSKSEALSRAISAAADAHPAADAVADAIAALRALQQVAQVSEPSAKDWARAARAERQAGRRGE